MARVMTSGLTAAVARPSRGIARSTNFWRGEFFIERAGEMHFEGKLTRQGRWWHAEVPVFEADTQGRTRKAALAMMGDWFASMAGDDQLQVDITASSGRTFAVTSANTGALVRLLLQRHRQRAGLTLRDVAKRLGATSSNAYARYERGPAVPSVAKLQELLQTVSPGCSLTVYEPEKEHRARQRA